MIIKRYIKLVFLILLLIIMISLSIIAFSNENSESVFRNVDLDYNILYKNNDDCKEKYLLFTDDINNYYCCLDGVYLQWDNGEITLLKDSLLDGKVSYNSLVSHGLNITSEMIDNEN